MFFYRLFVLLLFAIEKSSSLKCYSCGDENIFLGQKYSNPLPCDDLEKSDNLDTFIIECPEEYLGCITQSRGNEVMRTCDTLAIDDCETANGIKYCYCSQDLCNGKQSHVDAQKASRALSRDLDNYPSDDEDYGDDDAGNSGNGHLREHDHNDDENDDEEFVDGAGRGGRHPHINASQRPSLSKDSFVFSISLFLLKTFVNP